MKIKFELDGDFPLDKTFSISNMIIAAVSVLGKNGKYYPQFFLHECAYKLEKCYSTKKLVFQKELTLIKQVYQKKQKHCNIELDVFYGVLVGMRLFIGWIILC